MTETAIEYQTEPQIDEPADELTELNFKVAAIAGWTEIKEWHISRNQKANASKKIYIGKSDRRELGIFIPDYTSDLTAISNVFRWSSTNWSVTQYTNSVVAWALTQGNDGDDSNLPFHMHRFTHSCEAETPAIALCNLLLKLYG